MKNLQSSPSDSLLIAAVVTILIMAIGFTVIWLVKSSRVNNPALTKSAKNLSDKLFTEEWARRLRLFLLVSIIYFGFKSFLQMYIGNLGLGGILFFVLAPAYILIFLMLIIPWEKKGRRGVVATIIFAVYFILYGITGSVSEYLLSSNYNSGVPLIDIIIIMSIYALLLLSARHYSSTSAADKKKSKVAYEVPESTPSIGSSSVPATMSTPTSASNIEPAVNNSLENNSPDDRARISYQPEQTSRSEIRRPIFYYSLWIVLSIVVIVAFFDAFWTSGWSSGRTSEVEEVRKLAIRGSIIAAPAILAQLYAAWHWRKYLERHILWWFSVLLPLLGLFFILFTNPSDLMASGFYFIFGPILWAAIILNGLTKLMKYKLTK